MDQHQFTVLCHLAALLSPEEQLSFLRVFVATEDTDEKNRLAGRALNGERIWDAMPATSALCYRSLENLDARHFHTA